MKKIISLVFTVFVLLSSFQIPVVAQEAEESSISSNLTERITLFESYIEQDKSTEITITEKIHYYFPTSKHGIFRKIPTSYKVKGGFQRPTILVVKNLKYYPEDKPHDIRDSYTKNTESLKIGHPCPILSFKCFYLRKKLIRRGTTGHPVRLIIGHPCPILSFIKKLKSLLMKKWILSLVLVL